MIEAIANSTRSLKIFPNGFSERSDFVTMQQFVVNNKLLHDVGLQLPVNAENAPFQDEYEFDDDELNMV